MEQEPPADPGAKSFRLRIEKYGYGKLLIVSALFSQIYTGYELGIKPHSLSATASFLVALIRIILDTAVCYFLVMWLVNGVSYLIRRRRKVQRPEGTKVKRVINIVFLVLFLGMISSVVIGTIRASSAEPTPEQAALIQELGQKYREFSLKSDLVKAAMVPLLGAVSSQETSKMKSSLQGVLSATLELQPEIDSLKEFMRENKDILVAADEQQAIATSLKALDIRDRHNRKLAELATFGLTIDWDNPTKEEMAKWTALADQLAVIEDELKAAQADSLSQGRTPGP